jgi:hypothetical protein
MRGGRAKSARGKLAELGKGKRFDEPQIKFPLSRGIAVSGRIFWPVYPATRAVVHYVGQRTQGT